MRFDSRDRYVAGTNVDDSGSLQYRATLPVAGLMYAWSPQVHVYGAWGRGFETPTLNELAYRSDGSVGMNFALQPSRSRNFELGVKARTALGGDWRSQWTAGLFQVDTDGEIVTRTNSGGRSSFQNAGTTRRRGLELAWNAATDAGWQVQAAQTWLDASYREHFASCTGAPCAPLLIPQGNRIPGTARSVSAVEVAWQPARCWRGAVERRRSGAVPVNDANTDAAPSYTTVAVHGGYAFKTRGWDLAAVCTHRQPFQPAVCRLGHRQRRKRPLLRARAGPRLGIEGGGQLRVLRVRCAPHRGTRRWFMLEQQATREQLEARILEQMHDAVIFVDPNGVVRIWNRGAETIFGFTAKEVVGGPLDVIVPDRFRSAHANGFQQAVAAGRLKSEGRVLTTRANAKSGRRLYVDFSFGLLKAPSGELLGVFAVGRDATARRLSESAGTSGD